MQLFFKGAIKRAAKSCESSKIKVSDHFDQEVKMVNTSLGSEVEKDSKEPSNELLSFANLATLRFLIILSRPPKRCQCQKECKKRLPK